MRLFCEALVAPSVRAAMSNPWPPAKTPTQVSRRGRRPTQSHGSLPPVARSSETHHRHGAGSCGRRWDVARTRLRYPYRQRYRKDHHSLCQSRLVRRFWRQLVPDTTRWPGKGPGTLFLADAVGAEEALALGLFNRVVPDDKLEEETAALASRLANGPTVTLGYMKKNLMRQFRSLWRNA